MGTETLTLLYVLFPLDQFQIVAFAIVNHFLTSFMAWYGFNQYRDEDQSPLR